ncbi:hypothetical protein [Streptomyces sp. NPDC055134]
MKTDARVLILKNVDEDSWQFAVHREQHLRDWYRERDLLPGGLESVVGADSLLDATVERIMNETGLAYLSALDR